MIYLYIVLGLIAWTLLYNLGSWLYRKVLDRFEKSREIASEKRESEVDNYVIENVLANFDLQKEREEIAETIERSISMIRGGS